MVFTLPTSSDDTNRTKPARFELLTLGDELLLGLTPNGHLTFIGAQLGRRGVLLQRNITLTDDADAIERQFAESWRNSDVVITTGGLGPTCDDRTREAIASVLGQQLVRDPAIVQVIHERFAKLGRPMTPNNLKQADRPERAEVLLNANGTAPGLWVEQDGKVLCMLPGPPNELQPMFLGQVIPRLARLGLISAHEAYVQIRTVNVGESMLETRFQPIFDRYGDALSIAYCAHLGAVDCRVSSPHGELSFAQLASIARECAALLGEDFLCYGHESLASVIGNLLQSSGRMIAVAEVATNGLLANSFADLLGDTQCFAGGLVCHGNESKIQLLDVPEEILLQHTSVSAETAVAMATGAAERLGADYALAVTGFLGDAERTAVEPSQLPIPPGTIYLALFSPRGVWAKTLSYPGPRETVRQRAITAALDWLRRELLQAQR